MKLYYSRNSNCFTHEKTPNAICFDSISDELAAILVARTSEESETEEMNFIYNKLFGSKPLEPTAFTRLVVDHMARIGCTNAKHFEELTLLDKTFYFQIIRHDKRGWSINTILSLIAGFRLNHLEAEELFSAANIKLQPELYDQDRIYSFMMTIMQGKHISLWNKFLKKRGMPLLGSKKRL